MKLSLENKKKMREEIIKNLEQVPEGQRIHLDKELLEQLLFFPVIIKNNYNLENGEKNYTWDGKFSEDIVYKIPVWSGDFLKKIDLSEISFENAMFGNRDLYDSYLSDEQFELLKKDMGEEQYRNVFHNLDVTYIHNFSGTNIVLDFNKIEHIQCCDLSNVDLSKSNFHGYAYKCNFANTGVKLNFADKELSVEPPEWCDFSNNDFSDQTVHYSFFDCGDMLVDECDFKNTGLNIIYDVPSLPVDIMKQILNLCDFYGLVAVHGIDEHILKAFYSEPGCEWYKNRDGVYKERNYKAALEYFLKKDLKSLGYDPNIAEHIIKFRNLLTSGGLDGCYINGKKVLSKEEREQLKNNKIEEYQQYEEEMMSLLSTSLEEQVKHHKR